MQTATLHQVIDSQNRIKLESTKAICQAWVKHYRAEFFCRIVPVQVTQQASKSAYTVFAY